MILEREIDRLLAGQDAYERFRRKVPYKYLTSTVRLWLWERIKTWQRRTPAT